MSAEYNNCYENAQKRALLGDDPISAYLCAFTDIFKHVNANCADAVWGR